MGILGKIMEKAVDKITGRGGGLAARSAPTVASVKAPASRPTATSVPPAPVAPPSPPPDAGPTHDRLGGRGGVAVLAGSEGPVAQAEALANIEAGCQEVKERFDCGEPVVLLDVREPGETAQGVIPGAWLIPLGQLEGRWQELEKINEVVCYCASGKRSLVAAQLLRDKGIFNATSLEGGFAAWNRLGGKVGQK